MMSLQNCYKIKASFYRKREVGLNYLNQKTMNQSGLYW